MRDYKTVAQRVLQRRDAYVLAKKRKRQMIIKYAVIPACLFLVIGASIRIWEQTNSGRHVLEQNAVEMTNATTANTDSTDSALYETESQDRSDDLTPIQTQEILQENTDPIQTEALFTDAEPEPGHEAVLETRQTEHVMTEVIVLEASVVQESEPEQNAISPTEKIPESTIPMDENNTTETLPSVTGTSIQPTDPPESNDTPEPTETKQDAPPAPVDTDEPPAVVPVPSTTVPPQVPDVVTSTTKHDNHYEPTVTTTIPVKKPTNYTITVEEFTPTREQLSNVTHETVSMNFSENYDSFQQLFENAKAAVHCKVLSVAYTIMQDTPYTVYHIEIIDSLCGSFIAGDKLSIVQYGGYLVPGNSSVDDPSTDVKPPSDQEQTELIEQQIAGSDPPVVSQEYVLFLTPDEMFDGAYEALHENEGMFRYDPKTGELIRSVEQDAAINSSSYRQLLKEGENFIH